jgi:hypothetical protein
MSARGHQRRINSANDMSGQRRIATEMMRRCNNGPGHNRKSRPRADRERLVLVTTEKDLARMAGDPAAAEFLTRARALPVTLTFAEGAALERALRNAVAQPDRGDSGGHRTGSSS